MLYDRTNDASVAHDEDVGVRVADCQVVECSHHSFLDIFARLSSRNWGVSRKTTIEVFSRTPFRFAVVALDQ
jgi:hypothetical protein